MGPSMTPDFSFISPLSIERIAHPDTYSLIPAKDLDIKKQHIQSIVDSCSEPEIYSWLFKEMAPNGYTHEHANGFVNWAKQGWEENRYFVFFILTPSQEICGAIDIKSNQIEKGEVGYWISSHHRGLATNALKNLRKVAKRAGYKLLFAQTKEGNIKSKSVLRKNDFIEDSTYLFDVKCCAKAYKIEL
jgi:RimJ/RimL family protein N-acetyltransferase